MPTTNTPTDADHVAEQRQRLLDSDRDPLPLVDVESIVATYSDTDPKRETLDQYRRFMASDGFWTNIAREESIPKSRASNWKDGSKPSVVTIVDAAIENGWTAVEWTPVIEALADLVIGIHAGGSIGSTFAPRWHLDDKRQTRIRDALKTVGVGVEEIQGGWKPADHGAALGRALVAAGAPQCTIQNRDRLPDWVYLAAADRREQWLRTIVAQRGSQFKERSPTRMIRLDRPRSYLVDLAVLTETVTGVETVVHEDRVTVSADAVRELGLA